MIRINPLLTLIVSLFIPFSAHSGQCPQGQADFLYWSDSINDQIWKGKADGSEHFVITEGDGYEINSMALDKTRDLLYFSTYNSDTDLSAIYRMNSDGSNRQLVVDGLLDVNQINLDSENNHLYYALGMAGTINRINISNSQSELIHTHTGEGTVAVFDVDVNSQQVYYSVGRGLYRADFGGANQTEVIDTFNIRAVTYDPISSQVYFTESTQINQCALSPFTCSETTIAGLRDNGIAAHNGDIYLLVNDEIIQYDSNIANPVSISNNIPYSIRFLMDIQGEHIYSYNDALEVYDWSSVTRTFLVGLLHEIHGLAVDSDSQTLYFSSMDGNVFKAPSNEQISALNIGTVFENQNASIEFRGMTYDAADQTLYNAIFHASDDSEEITKIKTDGSNEYSIVIDQQLNIHDVALDKGALNNKLYWINHSDNSSAELKRANLDGSEIETLVSNLGSATRGLVIDSENERAIWTDHSTNQLLFVDLNDAMPTPQVFANLTSKPHDLAINDAGTQLYWTEGIGGSGTSNGTSGVINQADLSATPPLSGNEITTLYDQMPGTIRDITFVNECDNHLIDLIYANGFEMMP